MRLAEMLAGRACRGRKPVVENAAVAAIGVAGVNDRGMKHSGLLCRDVLDTRIFLITRSPPKVKTHSEPTSFRKNTGHGSVIQPLKSLVLRVKAAGCIVYQRRELSLRISKEYRLQDQVRAQSRG